MFYGIVLKIHRVCILSWDIATANRNSIRGRKSPVRKIYILTRIAVYTFNIRPRPSCELRLPFFFYTFPQSCGPPPQTCVESFLSNTLSVKNQIPSAIQMRSLPFFFSSKYSSRFTAARLLLLMTFTNFLHGSPVIFWIVCPSPAIS